MHAAKWTLLKAFRGFMFHFNQTTNRKDIKNVISMNSKKKKKMRRLTPEYCRVKDINQTDP